MKWLPWIILALAILAAMIAFMLLKNPVQRASITVGEPTIGGAAPDSGDLMYAATHWPI